MRPKPKIWGILTQWAQNNKFVESRLKNWALMNWTMVDMSLKDNSNEIAGTNMNGFPVRGGLRSYKSIETEYKYILDCYSLHSQVFLPFFRVNLSHYIAPFRSSSSYTCWSSKPSLEYLSHQTHFLVFCELE